MLGVQRWWRTHMLWWVPKGVSCVLYSTFNWSRDCMYSTRWGRSMVLPTLCLSKWSARREWRFKPYRFPSDEFRQATSHQQHNNGIRCYLLLLWGIIIVVTVMITVCARVCRSVNRCVNRFTCGCVSAVFLCWLWFLMYVIIVYSKNACLSVYICGTPRWNPKITVQTNRKWRI